MTYVPYDGSFEATPRPSPITYLFAVYHESHTRKERWRIVCERENRTTRVTACIPVYPE